MRKSDIIRTIFRGDVPAVPVREKGLAFAPTNIALCKYWGKRDVELNLPETPSLSIALPDKGSMTTVTPIDGPVDVITLNQTVIDLESSFAKRLTAYLDLFRPKQPWHLKVDISMNIPVAAGLASSACGYASLILSLNDLFDWRLPTRDLSVLARIGSGSAARSFWNGFVEWHAGVSPDGMDCYAEPLPDEWSQLCVGILPISDRAKPVSSRDAMQRTVNTSSLYQAWPKKVSRDLALIKQAIHNKNFPLLGGTAESNAMTMHATMLSSWPPVCYFLPETVSAMHQVWDLRAQGLELYFTQDAGPNLKLLFLADQKREVQSHFPSVEVLSVFE